MTVDNNFEVLLIYDFDNHMIFLMIIDLHSYNIVIL